MLKRGTSLRITDLEGGANVGAIFLNFEIPSERYNMPDTLKAQHTAHLTKGFVLYSDMGRVLCSITDDTCGWHDPICGHLTQEQSNAKYGELTYAQARNDFHRNARENFLMESEKFGLSLRDLPANVNFFSKVIVGDDGSLSYIENHSKAGDFIELRAEMNTIVILDTCQHPLDPNRAYQPRSIQISVHRTQSPADNDFCRNFRPENERGFINTERYFL